MHIRLTRDPNALSEIFRALRTPEDVAVMLEVSYRDLNYWIYRTLKQKRYTTFFIAKKNGTQRQIEAPNTNIKILQQKLNQVLQAVYRAKPSVHGFVTGKSVKSNAQQHVGKHWVFNIDLKDFFPSINFGRVRGMFMGKPYNLPQNVSTVLAHLCCHEGRLPQGAPTSPVISNMICAQMDAQLQQLAKANLCTYTRYADDMTFSCTTRRLPDGIAVLDELSQVHPGGRLREIVEQNGFQINGRKVWLSRQHRRQVVTGVTVNAFPNLPPRYRNQIRAMLHAWKKHGLAAAQVHWEAHYSTKQRASWRGSSPFEQVLTGKIEYLGMITGGDSPTYLKFLDQLGELEPKLTHGRGTPLRLLYRSFMHMSNNSTKPQVRGYQLERIMSSLFELALIHVSDAFRRNHGGEQLDGAFVLNGTEFLIECKWKNEASAMGEIDAFSGKVNRSGAQTMGMFIAIRGWSSNVVTLLKQNSVKNVVLMNGEDVEAVLAGKASLVDVLQAKVQALSIRAEPYLCVQDILKGVSTQAQNSASSSP